MMNKELLFSCKFYHLEEEKSLSLTFDCLLMFLLQPTVTILPINHNFGYQLIILTLMQQQPRIYGHINDICMIGHGSIGKGALPLILRHFTYDTFTIIDPDPVILPEPSEKYTFLKIGLTKENFKEILDKIFVNKLGFCVNLSFGISSSDLTQYCQAKGVLYVDTAKIEWGEFYGNKENEMWHVSNYWVRELLLKQVRKLNLKTTAISCCGANPGMASWLVKQALINIAKDTGYPMEAEPKNKSEWANLMKNLGVKGVHVAERDTQRSNEFRGEKEFWNTWSVEAFIAEGSLLPAELGWGTHEKWKPRNAREFPQGCKAAIYLESPGMNVQVKSWCPTYGPQFGFLITHDESISIADYFTVREGDKVVYRPTVHYAYHPAPDAVASAMEAMGSGDDVFGGTGHRILEKEIVTGMDELGVLVFGHAKNAYWYGSQLDIHSTRERAPNQNATALQVTSAVIAGMVWALENPEAGLVECDDMDYKRCLEVQHEYISPVRGYYTDWNPLKNMKQDLKKEDFDFEDPWQFKNIIMHK